MDPNNQERTARAERAIYALTGIYRDAESCTVDFLADLMHSWGRDGVTNALRNALRHHAAESGEPDAVAVFIDASDADASGEQLGRAIERLMERMDHYGPEHGEYQEMQSDMNALYRLADIIAAAAHQTTEDSL